MDILFVPLLVLAVVILVWWLGTHVLTYRLFFARDPIDDAVVTEEDYQIPEVEEEELDVPVASGEVGKFLGSVAEALDGGLTQSQAEILTLRIAGQKVDQVISGTYFVKAGSKSGKLGVWAFREKAAVVLFSFRGDPAVLAVVAGVGGVLKG
ncbi:MAG: hypothetical protein P8J87_05770 [Verrucomicrobiales bacterium]|nr:hypothetical protein [Verrucomicrobiales bacterium]